MKRISLLILALLSLNVYSLDRQGRLGIGFSNNVDDNTPSLSFKLQRTNTFSFGGVFGVNTANNGGWHGGIRLYSQIFDEPLLTFYGVASAVIINKKNIGSDSDTGFQSDLGFGTEFSISGIDSLGFSAEFGLRFKNIDEFEVSTMGDNFLSAGVHFYL